MSEHASLYSALKCVRGCATDDQFSQLSANVETLIRQVRAEALEEAARVCETVPRNREITAECAAAIRALKEKADE